MKIQIFDKALMHGVGLSHAAIGGGPVLRSAPWWRDINGIWFSTRRSVVFATFRRSVSRNR